MNSADLMVEQTIVTVSAPANHPDAFFAEASGEIKTTELLQLVVMTPRSVDKFVVSEITGDRERFYGQNANYDRDEFEMISPSLCVEDIFKIFSNEKKAKKFVDQQEAESSADYWMLYKLSMDEKKSDLLLVPQGRYKKTDE